MEQPPEASAMVNIVRLYLDFPQNFPAHMRPDWHPAVVDCIPNEAVKIKKDYQRRGFEVIALDL